MIPRLKELYFKEIQSALKSQFGISEKQVIKLMRQNMKKSSFKLWRERVSGRKTKHIKLRIPKITKAYCLKQYKP